VTLTLDATTPPDQLLASPLLPATSRVHEDILRLTLGGTLPLGARHTLNASLETLRNRVLHLELNDQSVTAPTADELEALTRRPNDPLTARVAANLIAALENGGADAATARSALELLHAELHR
jgi:hypothetical protein